MGAHKIEEKTEFPKQAEEDDTILMIGATGAFVTVATGVLTAILIFAVMKIGW